MFKKKLVENKTDLTVEKMPSNRKEVFIDALKHRYRTLLDLGFTVFLFALPILALAFYKSIVLLNFQKGLLSLEGDALIEEVKKIIAFDNLTSLIIIPLSAFFALGFAGTARIIRKLAFVEPVFKTDFKTGIKQNYRQICVFTVLIALCNFVLTYVNNASYIATGGVPCYIIFLPYVAAILFLLPLFMYASCSVTLYNNSIFRNLKIALALFVKHPLKTFVAVVLTVIPNLILLIPNFACRIVFSVLSVIFIPLYMLIWWLVCYDLLDKEVNLNCHPELVGKGTVWREE